MINESVILFLVVGAFASTAIFLMSGRGDRESYRSEKSYSNPMAALNGEMNYGRGLD